MTSSVLRRWRPLLAGAAGAAAVVSVATVVSRATGFGRTLVFSGTVGTTTTGAAYTRANLVPNVLFEIVAGGVLAAVVVPLLASGLAAGDERGRRHADEVASALLTWVLTVLVPVAAVVALAARPIASVMISGDGVPESAVDLGADLLRMFALQLPLYGAGAVLSGVLHSHRRFLAPALAPAASSLVVIAAYVGFAAVARRGALDDPTLLGPAPRWLLGAGTTLGVAALTLPLCVPVARAGVRLRPRWSFPPGALRPAAALAGAGVVGVAAQQGCVLVVAALTRDIDAGRVLVLFGYAQAVTLLPHAVLVVPVITIVFPRLAEAAALARRDRFARLVSRSTAVVLLVALVGAACQVASARSVEHFFDALDAGRVDGLAGGLAALAPGVVGLGLSTHFARVLAAAHRARSVAVGTALGWGVATAGSLLVLLPGTDALDAMVVLGAANSAGMLTSAVVLGLAVRALAPDLPGVLARFGAVGALAALLAAAAGAAVARPGLVRLPDGRAAQALGSLGCVLASAALAAAVVATVCATLLRRRRAELADLVRRRPAEDEEGTG